MMCTPAISNLIRENKTFRINSAIQTGKKYGMQLMDDHLWQLYSNKVIDLQEMMDHARDPGNMEEKANQATGAVLSKGKGGEAPAQKETSEALSQR